MTRLRRLASLRHLPPRIAAFHWRARRIARRHGDAFSLDSAARPAELRRLLDLARGAKLVVEVGTGTAWTAIALALDDERRRVVTIDPVVRSERDLYLALVPDEVRERIELVEDPGGSSATRVEMVFIDSSHEYEETRETFLHWRERLAPGAVVAFHDYDHPAYPGVAEAIADLGLRGEVEGGLFIWRATG